MERNRANVPGLLAWICAHWEETSESRVCGARWWWEGRIERGGRVVYAVLRTGNIPTNQHEQTRRTATVTAPGHTFQVAA